MRKIFAVCIVALLIAFTCGNVFADEAPPIPSEGFSLTFPMETGAVGFWFPETGAFAAGLSHTFMRIQHSDIKALSLDFDGTIAQEVTNNDKTDDMDTLGGIGIKLNFDVLPSDKVGFTFLPSIGITALNNFAEFKKMQDILDNYSIAIYGTVLLYKW